MKKKNLQKTHNNNRIILFINISVCVWVKTKKNIHSSASFCIAEAWQKQNLMLKYSLSGSWRGIKNLIWKDFFKRSSKGVLSVELAIALKLTMQEQIQVMDMLRLKPEPMVKFFKCWSINWWRQYMKIGFQKLEKNKWPFLICVEIASVLINFI